MEGFSITIRDEKFRVKFYHNKEKNTVVCVLDDQWGSYTGKAKCNVEAGDKYSETIGEKLSLERAIDKRTKHENTVAVKEYSNRIKVISQQKQELYKKWLRMPSLDSDRLINGSNSTTYMPGPDSLLCTNLL